MSAHVLLNLLNELRKRDKMRGRMLDSIYHMTNTLKSHFWRNCMALFHSQTRHHMIKYSMKKILIIRHFIIQIEQHTIMPKMIWTKGSV